MRKNIARKPRSRKIKKIGEPNDRQNTAYTFFAYGKKNGLLRERRRNPFFERNEAESLNR